MLRLYQKFRVPEGPNRRTRLANEVIALGLVRPLADYGSGQVQHAHGVPQEPLAGHQCSDLPSDGSCGSIQLVPGHSSGGWASAEDTAAAASAQQR